MVATLVDYKLPILAVCACEKSQGVRKNQGSTVHQSGEIRSGVFFFRTAWCFEENA